MKAAYMFNGEIKVGEIIDYGSGSARKFKTGTRVTSVPVITHNGKHSIIGYSGNFPGGFGEYMLLDENAVMEIPGELDDDSAALIEPLAVGLEHARAGEPSKSDVALVIGCGAIGLGVIAGLKLMGIAPIIAADFDASRLDIAIQMGADIAVDPRELSPYAPIPSLGMRSIADGRVNIKPWLSGPRIGLRGVAAALEQMKNPSAPVRTVVDPSTL